MYYRVLRVHVRPSFAGPGEERGRGPQAGGPAHSVSGLRAGAPLTPTELSPPSAGPGAQLLGQMRSEDQFCSASQWF